MSEIDQELLTEFARESGQLVAECAQALEDVEADHGNLMRLEDYSNRIDRIMGAARSLGMLAPPGHALHVIGDCTALCKALGYRCLTSSPSAQMIEVTVAFLLDATELVEELLGRLDESGEELRDEVRGTLVERLRWVADLYREMPSAPAVGDKMDQGDIDALMKKLGMG